MRKLIRKGKLSIKKRRIVKNDPHKIKKYKKQKCNYIEDGGGDGVRCKRNAVGKGTLCKKHGGNPVIKENLVPVEKEKRQLISYNRYQPEKHPIEFIDYSRRGESEVEIAARFEVSIVAIKNWSERYESFAVAYEIGQAMHEAWWIAKGKDNLNARDFNTTLFKFLTSNKLGYSDKMETKAVNLNVHGVLKVPDSVTEDEWEKEGEAIDVTP